MGGLRALPGSAAPSSLRAPLSRIVCSGAVPGPSPTSRAPQFPDWGARPPGSATDAPHAPPHPAGPGPPDSGLPPVGSSGVGELRLLSGSLSSDRVRELVLGTRASSSPGRTRAVNTPGIARLWGALLASARDLRGSEACSQEGTRSGTVQRAQLYTVFKWSHTLRPNNPPPFFF